MGTRCLNRWNVKKNVVLFGFFCFSFVLLFLFDLLICFRGVDQATKGNENKTLTSGSHLDTKLKKLSSGTFEPASTQAYGCHATRANTKARLSTSKAGAQQSPFLV